MASISAVVFICLCSLPYLVEGQCNDTTQFTCSNGSCIDISLRFNGVNDCYDNTDEVAHFCAKTTGTFACTSTSSCIDIDWVYDGDADCTDGSDEQKVIGRPCNPYHSCCNCSEYVNNSLCDGSVCRCMPGYQVSNYGLNCTIRQLGDPCESDSDCYHAVENTVCNSTMQCQCTGGYYTEEGQCTRRMVNDSCVDDKDCSLAVNSSTCVGQQCQCDSGHLSSNDRTACNLRKIGDECELSDDCTDAIANSNCTATTCQCANNYVAHSDKAQCLPRAIGDKCSFDSQCEFGFADSVCRQNICRCPLGYNMGRVSCIKRKIGDPTCHDKIECSAVVTNSVCVAGTCQCKEGFYTTDNTRCTQRRLRDTCTNAVQCSTVIADSTCIKQRCACMDGYLEVSGNCTVIVIGALCTTHSDCAGITEGICGLNGTCECRDGFQPEHLTSCFKHIDEPSLGKSSEGVIANEMWIVIAAVAGGMLTAGTIALAIRRHKRKRSSQLNNESAPTALPDQVELEQAQRVLVIAV